MRERWIANRTGRRMLVRDHGDATDPRTPILALPGYARTGRDYEHVADWLAPRRVVTLDYRGRGRSDREIDWRAYDPPGLLDDLRHLLVATGLHRVVVIGTSLGGILAMGMGVVLPSAVSAVVLNDVGPEVEPAGAEFVTEYIGRDNPQSDWPQAVATLKRMMPDLSLRTEEDWLTFARHTFREGDDGLLHVDWDPAIARPLLEPLGEPVDLWPLFRSLRRIPVLAIRGGESPILSAETLDRMSDLHPGMRRLILPGVGHAPTLDEPEARKAIRDFLAAH